VSVYIVSIASPLLKRHAELFAKDVPPSRVNQDTRQIPCLLHYDRRQAAANCEMDRKYGGRH